ncbi:MAG TPA: radical SAM protein [Spirochaetaceae bacterium]|nr:radical SAM protein [Spirochaetaceae bacterium]
MSSSSPAYAPARLAHPSRLIVETTTRCNLACEHCPKQSAGAEADDADMDDAVFGALAESFPTLQSLVLNGIGEPLMHSGLEGFIRSARTAMPQGAPIGFQTNGQLLDRGRARALLEAGLNRVCISVDALDAALFSELRAGGSRSAAERAIAVLNAERGNGRDQRAANGGAQYAGQLELGIEFVARKQNLAELPKIVRWAAARGVDFMLVSQLFPYEPSAMEDAAWDANLDVALLLRKKYEERARVLGLELGRYPEIYMRYKKSPEEELLVRLVDDLQSEAIAQGITVNVQRLLSADLDTYERSASAFAEAERIAKEEGLRLELPELKPRSARSCEFVEGGSAFVSRAGGVHPCYFLWHRYACYAGGWEKRVAPMSFGSLSERGILDIWNSLGFASFRTNVLRYEYPFCLNCNLALCDYLQLEDFEQDCHINAEPCAACMWCMGLFKCLT